MQKSILPSMERAVRNLLAAVLLTLAVSFSVLASEIPDEPRTLRDFEAVWDYAVSSDANRLAIHYSEKQSVNVYQKYRNIIQIITQKYRYVHPEFFNYLSLKNCSFVEDEGSRYGFTMVLDFGDLNGVVSREYYAVAMEKAKELYEETAVRLSPDMTQRERARILCQAISDRVYYKNDRTALCHTAYCALENGYAVCDGYTSLLNMLLRLDGIECEGRLGNANQGLHSWTWAKLDGEWLNIDATWFDGHWPEYAGITDDEISATHTVDLSYPTLVYKEAGYYHEESCKEAVVNE